MPSHVEGFKEGADDDVEIGDVEIGDPCDVSGNTPLYTINGETEYTTMDGKNEVVYKCDASNNVIIA